MEPFGSVDTFPAFPERAKLASGPCVCVWGGVHDQWLYNQKCGCVFCFLFRAGVHAPGKLCSGPICAALGPRLVGFFSLVISGSLLVACRFELLTLYATLAMLRTELYFIKEPFSE